MYSIFFGFPDWAARYPDSFEQNKLVAKLVKEGKLGIKSGEGIYKYNK